MTAAAAALAAPGGASSRLPNLEVVGVLSRLPSVRELTSAQKNVLYLIAERIVYRGGTYVEGQGELAAELNLCRRTVVRATNRLRDLDLLHAAATRQAGTGGTDKLRYRLPRWLFLLVVREPRQPETRHSIGCDTSVTPYPKGTDNRTSKLRRRRESGAPTGPEQLFCALSGAVTAPLGEADRRVLLQVANTLPESYFPAAIAAAARLSRSPERIYAPGAYLRQQLAAELAADGVSIPSSWRVRPVADAELVAVRERRARGQAANRRNPVGTPKKQASTLPLEPRSPGAEGPSTPRSAPPPGWMDEIRGLLGRR